MRFRPRRSIVLALVLSGCAAVPPSAQTTPSTAVPAKPGPGTAQPAASASSPSVDANALTGSWRGQIADATTGYPITIRLTPCAIGEVCGESEYEDPARDGSVLCAAELHRVATDPGQLSLREVMSYHASQCLAAVLTIRAAADGAIEVEAAPEAGAQPFAHGRLTAAEPPVDAGVSTDPVPGLGTPTATTPLPGATTQYGAAGFGSLWLPIEDAGEVVRVDASSGEITARIPVGNPGAVELRSDPHGVAVDDAGVWVTAAADSTLEFIDPATDSVTRTIAIGAPGYAIAIDGNLAWVTSFQDSLLVEVDLEAGRVLGTVEVASPTGVALGRDAVWVVEHRANTVVRVDPATRRIIDRAEIAQGGPNALCGYCVENLVVAADAVWTADNHGRSVTRIDPRPGSVAATVALPLRVWAVAEGGGRVWASQFDGDDTGDRVVDPAEWKLAEIDPATGRPTLFDVPSQGVFVTQGAVWVFVPGRRGDLLTRIALDP